MLVQLHYSDGSILHDDISYISKLQDVLSLMTLLYNLYVSALEHSIDILRDIDVVLLLLFKN